MTAPKNLSKHHNVLRLIHEYFERNEPVDYSAICERLSISMTTFETRVSHLLHAGLMFRTGKKRSRRYIVSQAAIEIIERQGEAEIAAHRTFSDALLAALAPYANAGTEADYDKIALALGVKFSTVRSHVSRLLGAQRLFRVGGPHSRRFSLIRPTDYRHTPEKSLPPPTSPSVLSSSSFIRPLSKEQLMRGRA